MTYLIVDWLGRAVLPAFPVTREKVRELMSSMKQDVEEEGSAGALQKMRTSLGGFFGGEIHAPLTEI